MALGRKGLGKGLDALLGEYVASPSEGVHQIDVDLIDINTDQPRKDFDRERLEDLRDSIELHGVVQPIIVRRVGDRYTIVAGERRFRASRMANLRTVPAIIRDFSDSEVMEVALIENIQRENLNPIEVASAIDFLVKQHDLTHDEVARRIGKSRPAVTNSLRLLTLPSSVQDKLRSGKLQMGHARALAAIKDDAEIERLADRAASQGWSVRETEKRASAANEPKQGNKPKKNTKSAKSTLSPDTLAALDALQQRLGTRVVIDGTEQKGTLSISYHSLDELNAIYALLMAEES